MARSFQAERGNEMPSFTRKAIMEAFMQLLNERPVSKISVKDIVELCGINRNTFYYHFQDIPSLIEAIAKEETDFIISKYARVESYEQCLQIVVEFILKNRRATLHLYNSANRDLYDQYLMDICRYAAETYFHTAFADRKISPSDYELIINSYKCYAYGLSVDWLNSGLQEDILPKLARLCALREGMIEEMFKRAEQSFK